MSITFNTTLVVQFGNGDGTFQPPQVLVTIGLNSTIFAVSIGDFNNDGSPDFAVEEGGVIEVLVGNGRGGFVSKGSFPESELSSFAFVSALLLADFNGDGLLDVAAADGFDDNVPVLLGNGDGTLGEPRLIVGGGHTAAAVSADFNADGRPDIALATTAPTARPDSAGEVILLVNTTPK
ncbi:MAG: VCBS repeat-containing protein [Bryobacteraceae bacterium]